MKKLAIIILAALCVCSCASNHTPTDNAAELRFKDGKFKIAQVTDIHLNPEDPKSGPVADTLLAVLERERPDLVVMTGDIVTHRPAEKGWRYIMDMEIEIIDKNGT